MKTMVSRSRSSRIQCIDLYAPYRATLSSSFSNTGHSYSPTYAQMICCCVCGWVFVYLLQKFHPDTDEIFSFLSSPCSNHLFSPLPWPETLSLSPFLFFLWSCLHFTKFPWPIWASGWWKLCPQTICRCSYKSSRTLYGQPDFINTHKDGVLKIWAKHWFFSSFFFWNNPDWCGLNNDRAFLQMVRNAPFRSRLLILETLT